MKSMLLRAGVLALALLSALPATAQRLDTGRSEVQQFVAEMRAAHGFDSAALVALLGEVQVQTRILELIQRPAERTLAWWEYRERFLTEERIAGGARLWREHRDTLERIAGETGVPPQFMVAITGVETFYGRVTGSHRVLDALATLAFDYPPRAAFFRSELQHFLLMTREEGIDPRQPRGSYAGAMGIPQFIPSSFRAYAVDGSGDGRRDLWQHGPDVFASIANYFRAHGWRAGEPVLSEASHEAAPDDPAGARAVLEESVALLRGRGYRFDTALPDEAPAMLVPAAGPERTDWRVGYQNFYVITRYNRSLLYAMAVNDLAEAIAARFEASLAASTAPAAAPES